MNKQPAAAKSLILATAFTFVFMAGFALSAGMLGTLLPRIMEAFGITVSEGSTLNVANEIGNVTAMLLSLVIVDRLDKHDLLCGLSLVFGLFLLVFGKASAFAILLLVRLGVGFVGGMLDNTCAAYISDIYGEKRTRYISILHTLYAIGSLLGPKFAAFCFGIGGWNLSFVLCGSAFVAASLLFIVFTRLMGKPASAVISGHDSEKEKKSVKVVFQRKEMWTLGFASLFSTATTCLIVWLPTFLDRVDPNVYTTDRCATVMSAYSLGMMLSRIILAAVSDRIAIISYIRIYHVVAAALLTAFIFINNPLVWVIGMFVFGLLCGAGFTARFALSCSEFPEFSAAASSFTGGFAALGNILFSLGFGKAADAGMHVGAMVALSISLLIAGFVFLFLYRSPEERTVRK